MHRSPGYSSPLLFLSESEWRRICQHLRVGEISIEDGAMMLAWHLAWQDSKRTHGDFLSFTNSVLFALVHAIQRHEKGQRYVYMAGGWTDKLQARNGFKSRIFSALALYEAFEIRQRFAAKHPKLAEKTDERFATHEFLLFLLGWDLEGAIQHVLLEDLVSEGLYDWLPELKVKGLDTMTGLYECLTALRRELFDKVVSPPHITKADIRICAQLAFLYKARKDKDAKPPLAAFLGFLCLRKLDVEKSPAFDIFIRRVYRGNLANQ
jgi:hypothetical protein